MTAFGMLRLGIRSLIRQPAYCSLVVALMALTTGAVLASFSALRGVVLKALPYKDAERLVAPQLRDVKRSLTVGGTSMPTFLDLSRLNHTLEYLGAYYTKAVTITGSTAAEDQAMMIGSPAILKVLGAPLMRGRYFTEADDARGGRAAIISHSLWKRRFLLDEGIIGKQIVLNGIPFQIVGVTGPGFDFGSQLRINRRPIEVWITHAIDREPLLGSPRPIVELREAGYLSMIGKLKAGITPATASADLTSALKGLAREYPDAFGTKVVVVTSELERLVGPLRPVFLLLFGGTALLLLIGCANVANLTLTRALGRGKEYWLKQSLGASRVQLAGPFVAEGMILSMAAGGMGLILGLWGLELMRARLEAMMPRPLEAGLDWQVALFAMGVSAATGLIFISLPEWVALSSLSQERGSGRGQSSSRGTQWSRRSLVMAQVAVAMVLLASTAVVARNLVGLLRIDLGFRPEGVSMFSVNLPAARYKLAAQASFYRKLTEELATVPGTESVAAVTPHPLGRLYVGATFQLEDGMEVSGEGKRFAEWHVVTPRYFRTLGIQQIAGRDFDGSETLDSKQVAIINESMARKWFAGRNPLGQKIRLMVGNNPPFREIVGVVSDAKQRSIKAASQPAIYLAHAQFPFNSMTVFVKRAADPMGIIKPARRILAGLDREVPLKTPALFSDQVAEATASQRVGMMVLSVISAVALLLCAGGLYGVVAYSTAQRRQEIAIRLALGATAGNIRRRYVADAALVCTAGLVAGGAGAYGLRNILTRVLEETKPVDSMMLAGVGALVLGVTLIAGYVPARRASRADVARELNQE